MEPNIMFQQSRSVVSKIQRMYKRTRQRWHRHCAFSSYTLLQNV